MAPIEVRSLTKRFGSVTAVDDVSFDVQPGKVTGFLGPNGAGKTTTLRMILGLAGPRAAPRRSTAGPTGRWTTRRGRWAPCWSARAFTPAGAPGTT